MQTIEISDETYRRLCELSPADDPKAIGEIADRKLRREMNWAAIDRVRESFADRNQADLQQMIDEELDAVRTEQRAKATPDAGRD